MYSFYVHYLAYLSKRFVMEYTGIYGLYTLFFKVSKRESNFNYLAYYIYMLLYLYTYFAYCNAFFSREMYNF